MSPINRTANSHQTSFLVSQHVPAFVREDHPKFITFIEKYYEFASNNSVLETSAGSGVYYYGFDSASKLIQDINDVDRTDFDQFVESFRKEYAYSFPQELYNGTNKATLYKNLIQFYQAVGTEDSFRASFRLLYNEEIEICLSLSNKPNAGVLLRAEKLGIRTEVFNRDEFVDSLFS